MQVPEALIREREKHATQHEFILKSVDSAKQALAEAECRQRIAEASIAAFDFSIRVIEDIEMPITVTPADDWGDVPFDDPVAVPPPPPREERKGTAKPRQPKRDLRQTVIDAINAAGKDGIMARELAKDQKILFPRLEEIVINLVADRLVETTGTDTNPVIVSTQYSLQERDVGDEMDEQEEFAAE